ncbi:hypothetical protein ACFFX0_18605 [Citricoccus parietis]|uniref:Uncharacterized protein n=1 Tax=Citricoccus parietis TaxID=592307 RepID=A0ABV5G2G1_9MICC
MTWSPTATEPTPSPTASTTPEPSWPSTPGSGRGMSPAWVMASVWHTPEATTRTRTSPGPGCSSSSSSRTKGAFFSSTTSASIFTVAS